MPSPRAQSVQPNSRSRRTPKCVPAVWLAATALAAFAACDTPGVTLIEPDRASGPDTVTFHVQLEDTALAQVLGWKNGVPNAEIQLHRILDPFRPDTVYTDSTGHVLASDLLYGFYRIAAYRAMTADEVSQSGGVKRAFGDGIKRWLPTDSIELTLGVDQPGSLVVSELYIGGGTPEIDYNWSQFFELYNNSDTTVYVDGMLWGWAYGRFGSADPCEESQAFRTDALGLWSRGFHQFPGAGQDYPVAPGQTVTVAMDAVDHSVAHQTLPDLSKADFELEGTSDADNPDVPNLPEVGLYRDLRGHGMIMTPWQVLFLASPVDPAGLVTSVIRGSIWARIPADAIVDVLHGDWVNLNGAPQFPPIHNCYSWVNREFDRMEAAFYRPGSNDNTASLHRRVLRTTLGGRAILQDVNVSFLDFVVARYSPGSIEY